MTKASSDDRYYQVKMIVRVPKGTDAEAATAGVGLLNLSLGGGWHLLGPAREPVDVTDRVNVEHKAGKT